jgi:isopenicillin N synthase-like dioxygenase
MGVPTFSFTQLTAAARAYEGAGHNLLEELDAALMDPGAFRLSDLPLSEDLVADMHQVTTEFFRLPLEDKVRYRFVDDQYVGWCGDRFLSEYGSRDRKEMFHIGPRVAPTLPVHADLGSLPEPLAGGAAAARAACSLWPEAPDRFVEVWHRYYRAMQDVAAALGTVFARALGIDPADWFAALDGNWADLAANYYPPIPVDDPEVAPVYNPPHRDLTVFTILHQDQSRAGGLSVQSADGSWTDVLPIEGTYVVNVGDLLTYLSGGRWRAAPHQVTVAPDRSAPAEARISIPFFYRPSDHRTVRSFVDADAVPVAVGDWVLERKKAVA